MSESTGKKFVPPSSNPNTIGSFSSRKQAPMLSISPEVWVRLSSARCHLRYSFTEVPLPLGNPASAFAWKLFGCR